MVTFQLFVIPALDLLGGAPARPLPLLEATLVEAIKEKANLTHFLPARLEWHGLSPRVSALRWQGSGDIAALSRANCFLLVPPDRLDISTGEKVSVLPRADVL
jgi:molybdopterin molybdotransferase